MPIQLRKTTRRLGLLLALAMLPGVVPADKLVTFRSGRTLRALEIRHEGEWSYLQLGKGAEIGVPGSLILEILEVEGQADTRLANVQSPAAAGTPARGAVNAGRTQPVRRPTPQGQKLDGARTPPPEEAEAAKARREALARAASAAGRAVPDAREGADDDGGVPGEDLTSGAAPARWESLLDRHGAGAGATVAQTATAATKTADACGAQHACPGRDEHGVRRAGIRVDPLTISRSEHSVSRRQIDDDALKVLYRLHRNGRTAYLVGGGVRDLLLGITPKDFDVATDARPGEVKRLFRNSWIVGRRFRLVHVVFGRKVVEVATFRAKAEVTAPDGSPGKGPPARQAQPPARGGDRKNLLVTMENTFGNAEQDALRRDFTINALFYDIGTYGIIDYVGGLKDLRKRLIRTIGEPGVRFQEDPVRMMRAVKFAARLEFKIEPRTWEALRKHSADIALSAPPRVLEEIYRLLGSGRARTSVDLLRESGMLRHLVPEAEPRGKRELAIQQAALDGLDKLVGGDEEVSRPLQMAVLLQRLIRELIPAEGQDQADQGDAVQDRFRPLAQRLRMTRADTARLMQMSMALRRFVHPKGRRFSVKAFVRRGYFADSFQLFRILAQATGEHAEALESWEERLKQVGQPESGGEGRPRRARRPRRRRRRRRQEEKTG